MSYYGGTERGFTIFPIDDRQVFRVRRPLETFLLAAQFLELHGKLAFADFIVREDLKVSK